jgi:nitrite reductase/ring-hydroxylating ferredoxin subunit/uncharacterized membrane protein
MQPIFEGIADRISETPAFDDAIDRLQGKFRELVPDDSRLREVLSGTWLGHPAHPPLTDVVVGAWTCALVFDLIPTRTARKGADRLVALGLLASVPTALAGANDWSDLGKRAGRIGFVHGAGNALAATLQLLSWLDRKRGRRVRGVARSMAAMGIATITAYLGGHLSYSRGIGVNPNAFQELPEEFTPIADLASLPEGKPTRAELGRSEVLLYRTGSQVRAVADRCPHRACSLAEGEVVGDNIRCGCHGSEFRLDDGTVVRGPAASSVPALEARVRDGKVEVRLRAS